VTIAQDFTAAYHRVAASSPEPATVASRLAAAVTEVTNSDGAGVDVFDQGGFAVPIGASCGHTSLAEQLQFTVGRGPTYDAHRSGHTIMATEPVMARRWPEYHDLLVTRTQFRSAVALPLVGPLSSSATLDLLFHDRDAAASASLADISVLCRHITAALIEADLLDADARPASGGQGSGPVWLSSRSSLNRQQVWLAAGMLHSHLGVSTADAVKLLKAHAYAHHTTTDDVAVAVISGHTALEAFDLDD
jgi:hypothetical protein